MRQMIENIEFLQKAADKRGPVGANHLVRIKDGFGYTFDGKIAICAPLQIDVDCNVNIDKLLASVKNCKENMSTTLTAKGKLSVKSGKFKSYLQCVENNNHVVTDPSDHGEHIGLNDLDLVKNLKKLLPFLTNPEPNSFNQGVMFGHNSVFASNNVILLQLWIGFNATSIINVPCETIKLLCSINYEPESMVIDENAITFRYDNGLWLRSNLLKSQWPDVNYMLPIDHNTDKIPDDFYNNLKALLPLSDNLNRVYMTKGLMSTQPLNDENGASYESEFIKTDGVFMIDQLMKLKHVANQIDLSHYPEPCPFFGDKCRGVLLGSRS